MPEESEKKAEKTEEEKGKAAEIGQEAAKEKKKYWKRMLHGAGKGVAVGAKGVGKGAVAGAKAGVKKGKELGNKEVPRMSLFIFLIILGALDIFIKNAVGYEPKSSLLISIILGVIFFFAVKSNKLYRSLVIGAFALDVVISQGLLYLIPETEFKNILITFKVFIWIALAIILFILEMIEHFSEGEKPGMFADILLLAIIATLIFFLFPQLITTYDLQSQTHEEYFEIAKEELAKITETAEETKNIWGDYFSCIFSITEGQSTDACLEDKRIDRYCKEQEELEYDKCVQQQKTTFLVSGTVDPTIAEPTKAEFKVSEYFPKMTYQPKYPYQIELEICNPREQELSIDINCFFKKGKEIIAGAVEPWSFTITKQEDSKSITCTPVEDLDGFYTLVYQANIHNMNTFSRLTRLFVGDVSEKTKREIDELKRTYLPGTKYLSQAPKEFARINFGFGEPETNPLIEHDDQPLLVSTIENVGGGKILSVNSYQIDLAKEGITSNQNDCFEGSGQNTMLPVTRFEKKIPLTSCFLELPPELMNPEDFLLKEFTAALNYDYQIEKEIKIEAKILEGLVS